MNHKQLSELPESPKSPNETSIEIQTDISYATIYDNGKFNHDFISHLRVVQTKTILFLKSMSEIVGSDIGRL